LEEQAFGVAVGLISGREVLEEGEKVGASASRVVGQEEMASGGQAVLEGVARRGGLALGGPRAGGLAGVGAISGELAFGDLALFGRLVGSW
jgi:hypothetical protein